MLDASSNTSRMRLPLLCRPANASVLFSNQEMASVRHRRSCPLALAVAEVAPKLNHEALTSWRNHLLISGLVFVRSCPSVLLVMIALVSVLVDMAQAINMEIRQLFPMPWPEPMATLQS